MLEDGQTNFKNLAVRTHSTSLNIMQHATSLAAHIVQHYGIKHAWKGKSWHPEMFLGQGVLKICRKFTGDNPCRSVISIKLQSKASKAKRSW